jgi:hypothetical protein
MGLFTFKNEFPKVFTDLRTAIAAKKKQKNIELMGRCWRSN